MKILSSTCIDIKSFCYNFDAALINSVQGITALTNENKIIMYAVTPKRLEQLLKLEKSIPNPVDIHTVKKNNKNSLSVFSHPIGKFKMYDTWKPDVDFLKLAAIWGIPLYSSVTSSELASFISYWKAEERIFYHIQWQQKLARNVQLNRINNKLYLKNINNFNEPDPYIPDGFRG